jgi:hypothetical protein
VIRRIPKALSPRRGARPRHPSSSAGASSAGDLSELPIIVSRFENGARDMRIRDGSRTPRRSWTCCSTGAATSACSPSRWSRARPPRGQHPSGALAPRGRAGRPRDRACTRHRHGGRRRAHERGAEFAPTAAARAGSPAIRQRHSFVTAANHASRYALEFASSMAESGSVAATSAAAEASARPARARYMSR